MNPLDDDDDPETPQIYKPMYRGALKLDDDTTPESITDELEERLRAVFAHFSSLSSGGWREFALYLLLTYEPAFQLDTPVDRKRLAGGKKQGGADVTFERWDQVGQMKRLVNREGMSNDEAAKFLAKKLKKDGRKEVKASTLRNLISLSASGKIKAPLVFRRHKYEAMAQKALYAAADRFDQSRK